MDPIAVSIVALVISLGGLLFTWRTRQQNIRIQIAQKRTDVCAASNVIQKSIQRQVDALNRICDQIPYSEERDQLVVVAAEAKKQLQSVQDIDTQLLRIPFTNSPSAETVVLMENLWTELSRLQANAQSRAEDMERHEKELANLRTGSAVNIPPTPMAPDDNVNR